jgi:hypothetical protein
MQENSVIRSRFRASEPPASTDAAYTERAINEQQIADITLT